MTKGEQNRNEAYLDLIKEEKLGNQEEAVLRMFYLYPDSTNQHISELIKLPLATINGRRNSLVEKGLLIESGTNYDESNVGRTTYRVATQKAESSEPGCLTFSKMKSIRESLLRIRKAYFQASAWQVEQIKKELGVTLEFLENETKERK